MNKSHGSYGDSFLAAPLHINNQQAPDKVKSNPQTVELLNEKSFNISNSQISENNDVKPLSMPQCKSIKEEECKIPTGIEMIGSKKQSKLGFKETYKNKENKPDELPPFTEGRKKTLRRRKNLNLVNRSFVKGEEADSFYDKRFNDWRVNTSRPKISTERIEQMFVDEPEDSARKYLLKGILCQRKGKNDEAKRNYEEAITKSKEEVSKNRMTKKDAYLFLGNLVLYEFKNCPEAVEIFKQGALDIANDLQSIDFSNSFQFQTPEENLKVEYSRPEDEFGMSSIRSQTTDSSLQDINDIMEDIYQSFRHSLCEAYLIWVRQLVKEKEYDKAIDKLREIIAQNSSYCGDAYLCWGCILMLKEDFIEAEKKFSHVFKSSGPEKQVSKKQEEKRKNKYAELDEFKALSSKGNDFLRDNKFNDAISEFKKVLKLDPLDPRNSLGNWRLAKAFIYAGKHKKAVARLKKAYNLYHYIVTGISQGIVPFTEKAKARE